MFDGRAASRVLLIEHRDAVFGIPCSWMCLTTALRADWLTKERWCTSTKTLLEELAIWQTRENKSLRGGQLCKPCFEFKYLSVVSICSPALYIKNYKNIPRRMKVKMIAHVLYGLYQHMMPKQIRVKNNLRSCWCGCAGFEHASKIEFSEIYLDLL